MENGYVKQLLPSLWCLSILFWIFVMFSLFGSQLDLRFTFTSCSPILFCTFLSAAISKAYLLSALASEQVHWQSVKSLYPEQSCECCSSDLALFNAKLVSKAFFEWNGNAFSLDSYVAELWLSLGAVFFLTSRVYLYRCTFKTIAELVVKCTEAWAAWCAPWTLARRKRMLCSG